MEYRTVNTLGSIGAWTAAFLSYSVNDSILWSIFHFLCGWAYVAYRLVWHSNLLDVLK